MNVHLKEKNIRLLPRPEGRSFLGLSEEGEDEDEDEVEEEEEEEEDELEDVVDDDAEDEAEMDLLALSVIMICPPVYLLVCCGFC